MNDYFHGIRHGTGMGTTTVEVIMAQQLAGLVHKPLFQVFLDVPKSYDSVDRGVCMEILRGYGFGPNLHRLLQRYWENQVLVWKARKLFG